MSTKKEKDSEGKSGIFRGIGKKIRSAAGFTDADPYSDDREEKEVSSSGDQVTSTPVTASTLGGSTTVLQPDGTTITYPAGYQQIANAQQLLQAQQLAQAQQIVQAQQLAQAHQLAQAQQIANAQMLANAQVQAYNQQIALQSAGLVGGIPVAGVPVGGVGVAGVPVAGVGVAGVPVAGVYPQPLYPYGAVNTGLYPTAFAEVPIYDPETGRRIINETNQVSSVKDIWKSDLL